MKFFMILPGEYKAPGVFPACFYAAAQKNHLQPFPFWTISLRVAAKNKSMKLSGHALRAILILLAAGLLGGCSSEMDARGPSDICEIHHAYMQSVEFHGRSAGDPPSQEYLAARVQFFRHAYPVLLPHRFRTTYVIYVCDQCVQAERKWKAEHEIPVH
jgi:hypothetical protein